MLSGPWTAPCTRGSVIIRPGTVSEPRPEGAVGALSLDDFRDDLAANFGEPLPAPLVHEAERVLVQPELIQDGRVDVAEVVRLLGSAQADRVRCSDYLPAFDPATRHPHAEAEVVMVAPFVALRFGRAPELPAPDHERGT